MQNLPPRKHHRATSVNPTIDVKLAQPVRDRVLVFTPTQTTTLLQKADERLQPYLALCCFAGLRPEQAQGIRCDHIHSCRGAHGEIKVPGGTDKASGSSQSSLISVPGCWPCPKTDAKTASFSHANSGGRLTLLSAERTSVFQKIGLRTPCATATARTVSRSPAALAKWPTRWATPERSFVLDTTGVFRPPPPWRIGRFFQSVNLRNDHRAQRSAARTDVTFTMGSSARIVIEASRQHHRHDRKIWLCLNPMRAGAGGRRSLRTSNRSKLMTGSKPFSQQLTFGQK